MIIIRIQHLLAILLLLVSCNIAAECESDLPLKGVVSIKNCDSKTQTCISANEAIHSYVEAMKDDPSVLTISLQSSPWRFYDQNMRIINVEEIAAMAKPSIAKGVKRIELIASWSDVPPSHNEKSLAQKLSKALNDFPVTGMDGFLWLSKNGATHTTKQAFTIGRGSKPYSVAKGGDVMVSLASGWPINLEAQFIKNHDADGLMRVGAGLDIFALCPGKSLQAFEASAKLANPIAAYNAAMMRIDRHQKGDLEAATQLLSQAAQLGDKKSQAKLLQLNRTSQTPFITLSNADKTR